MSYDVWVLYAKSYVEKLVKRYVRHQIYDHVPMVNEQFIEDQWSEQWFVEWVDALAQDEKDGDILRLRMQGKTDEEIGAILGIGTSTTNDRRRAMGSRYLAITTIPNGDDDGST